MTQGLVGNEGKKDMWITVVKDLVENYFKMKFNKHKMCWQVTVLNISRPMYKKKYTFNVHICIFC